MRPDRSDCDKYHMLLQAPNQQTPLSPLEMADQRRARANRLSQLTQEMRFFACDPGLRCLNSQLAPVGYFCSQLYPLPIKVALDSVDLLLGEVAETALQVQVLVHPEEGRLVVNAVLKAVLHFVEGKN